MPTEPPAAPPWGTLITAALEASDMSARQAARQAGISDVRWGQVTRGYQKSGGVYAPARGSATTVARMAAEVGVTAQQLTAAGRPDAARALSAVRPADGGAEDIIARVQAMPPTAARALLADLAARLGVTPQPGSEWRRYGT